MAHRFPSCVGGLLVDLLILLSRRAFRLSPRRGCLIVRRIWDDRGSQGSAIAPRTEDALLPLLRFALRCFELDVVFGIEEVGDAQLVGPVLDIRLVV